MLVAGGAATRLRVGQLAWATSLAWTRIRGAEAQQRFGHRSGRLGEAVPVAVERAGAEHACAGCRRSIGRRELCGRALGGERYCAPCVTGKRPATEFVPDVEEAPEPVAPPVRAPKRKGAAA